MDFLMRKQQLRRQSFPLPDWEQHYDTPGKHLQSREIPLVGLTAAFIFVAQMLNFPVAGGTSGHLIGATLAMVLLGPSVAIIVMSSVLIIQAAIFADGGLLALGANIFNMAIVAPVSQLYHL